MKGNKGGNPTEGKSFAEMRRIGNNQQQIINQQQEMIDQQHKDLEQRAVAIENQRRTVETERMQFHQETKMMTRKTLDQGIYFAYMSVPWYQFWKRWSIPFMIKRAAEWSTAINAEVDRIHEANKPAGTSIQADEAETVIQPNEETVQDQQVLTARIPMGQANDDGGYQDVEGDTQNEDEEVSGER